MAEFQESRPCTQCDGMMDRRHGTLPVARPSGPAQSAHIASASSAVGTYYRCLKNGAHTLVVELDPVLPPRRLN